jgi:hypothetical protein
MKAKVSLSGKGITYKTADKSKYTIGLSGIGQRDIRVSVDDLDLLNGSETFLDVVISYIRQNNRKINPDETMNYGYWLVKFQESPHNDFLDVWEINLDGTTFTPGASRAIAYWEKQNNLCNQVGALFTPPNPHQLAAISKGVLEGEPINEGIRYRAPSHMSGWWFLTKRYDGDIKNLDILHLHHITAARSDLVRYISLPPGFCFSQTEEEFDQIWFDEKVLGSGK